MSFVDQRVVEMIFNNQQFEKGVDTTLNSIDKLDKSLAFSGVNEGLNRIGDAADAVSDRFSGFGLIATSALDHITRQAVDAGEKLVKSLTVDQLSDGFRKYESSVSNVKAIMNQSGESLNTVNKYIDQLSWYSDQTSFGFDSMTSALKSFTQQGIKLEDAIPMIMGIGNAVTYTGVGAKEGSAAFGYYAKAIAAGYMTNKEWQSISRTLGASSVGLKQQFMDAAVAAGTLRKSIDGKYWTKNGLEVSVESFDSTLGNLKGKWLTTAVMTKVLAGEYGNVSVQLKDLMDQYEAETGKLLTLQEATEMFADQLDETAVKYALSATEAKTFTEAIDATKDAVSSQFKTIFDSVFGNTEEAIKLWTDLNGYLVDTFATPFAKAAELASEWKRIGGREDLINSFWNITEALGSVSDALKTAWHSVFPAKSAGALKRFTERIEQFTIKLKDNGPFIEKFQTIMTGVFSALSIGKKAIKAVVKGLEPLIDGLRRLADSILGKLNEKLETVASNLFSFSTGSIGDKFENITTAVANFSTKVVTFFETLRDTFKMAGGGLDGVLSVITTILIQFVSMVITTLEDLTGWDLSGAFKSIITGLLKFKNGIVNTVDSIKNSGFVQTMKDFFESFKKKEDANGLEEKVSLLDRLRTAFEKIRDFLAPLTATIKEFFTTTWAKIKEGFANLTFDDALGALGGAAVGAGAFSIFTLIETVKKKFKNLGSLNDISKSISNFLTNLKDSLGLFKNGDSFGDTLKKIATSLLILAAALLVMSSIDSGRLWESIGAVAALFTELTVFSDLVSGAAGKNFKKTASGLMKVAAAVLLMSIGVKILGSINPGDMKQGISAMAIVLGELAAFTLIAGGKGKNKLGDIGKNMILIAASMLVFALSLKALGSINADVMAQGLKAMAIVLAEVAIASNLMPKNMVGKSIGLVVMGAALGIVASALKKLGSIDPKVMKQGLSSAAIALAEFAIALNLMKGTLGAAAAILITTAALAMFVPILTKLGNMDISQLGMGLLALAGVFAVLALGAFILKPLAGTLLAVSAAMALFGVGIAALAVGLGILAVNIELIAASVPVAIAAFVTGIGLFIKSLALIITDVVDAFVTIAVAVVTGILETLIQTIPKFGEFIITLITTLCDVISATAGPVVDAVLDIIVAVLQGIADHVGDILDAVAKIFENIFKYIKEKFPEFVEKGKEILMKIKEGIVNKTTEVIEEVKNFAKNIVETIKEKVSDFKQAGIDTIEGFIEGFKEKISSAVTWAKDLGDKIVGGLKGVLGINSPSKVFAEIGKYSVQGLSAGLDEYSVLAERSAEGVGDNVADALGNSFRNIADTLNDDIDLNPEIRPVLDLTDIQNGSRYMNTAFGSRLLTAEFRGRMSDFESQQALAMQFSQLRNDIYDALSGFELSPDSLGSAVRSALEGTGIYMDRDRVGKLVTGYQNNTRRASGAY